MQQERIALQTIYGDEITITRTALLNAVKLVRNKTIKNKNPNIFFINFQARFNAPEFSSYTQEQKEQYIFRHQDLPIEPKVLTQKALTEIIPFVFVVSETKILQAYEELIKANQL